MALKQRLNLLPASAPMSELPFGRIFRKVDGASRMIADWTIPPSSDGQPAARSLVIRELGAEATSWRLIYSFAASRTERYLSKQDREIELAQGRIVPVGGN
jgi:hypothetical protein